MAQDPLSGAATKLPSSGPSALEVAQQRAAYERQIAYQKYLLQLEVEKKEAQRREDAEQQRRYETQKAQQQSVEKTTYSQPKVPISPKPVPVVYDVARLPMDDAWGKSTLDLPSSIQLGNVNREEGGLISYTMEIKDGLFMDVESNEFKLYYERDQLRIVETELPNAGLVGKASSAFGTCDATERDEFGNDWYLWTRGNTVLAIILTSNAGIVRYYQLDYMNNSRK